MDDELIPEEPPKRRRGRPPKSVSATVNVGGDDEPQQRRTRRSSKVTADHVVSMTCQAFGLVALLTKRGHWVVQPDEVKPWAGEAASILNSIPLRYVKAFANTSGYLIVGIGLYGVVAPRIAMDQMLREQSKDVDHQQNATSGETVESSAEYHLYDVVGDGRR